MTAAFYDLVQFTTATTGTGTIAVGAALPGKRTPVQAGAVDGATVSYSILDGINYEYGRGVIGAGGTTLTRSPLGSSNANALISLSATAKVAFVLLAEDVPRGPNVILTNASGGSVAPGSPIYINGASTFGAAIANNASSAQATGLAASTIANGASGSILFAGLMTLTTAQWNAITGGSGGLTPGALYFVDPVTAGHLTMVATAYGGEYVVYIGKALSTVDMLIDIALPIALSGLPRPPTVVSISPNNGTAGGGTAVTITGSNLLGATAVTIDGVAVTSFTVVDAATITAVTATHIAADSVDVAVMTPGGTAIGAGLYTYNPMVPIVSAVSPTSGAAAGGATATVTGANFTSTTSVTFGGAAAGFSVTNDTHITATTPAHAAGSVDIAVSNPAGTGTGTGLYTYVAAPTVTGVSPPSGKSAGGTTVTITGTNFTGATAVTIGGTAATSFTVVNATTITAVTATHAVATVDVAVTNPAGTGTGTGLFTYTISPSTFSTADAAINGYILSNGNLSAANSGSSSGTWWTERGSNSKTSGQLYVEFKCTATGGGPYAIVGFANTGFSVISGNAIGFAPQSIGFNGNLGTQTSGAFTPINSLPNVAAVVNDVFGLAIDFSAGKIWVSKNNVWIGSGNPSTGANPSATFVPATVGALSYAISLNSSGDGTYTVQPDAASQTYPSGSGATAGFSAWG